MTLPYARTFDEVYLYLDTRPCICGVSELNDRSTGPAIRDGVRRVRIGGRCAGCGRPREFNFTMPIEPPKVAFDVCYGEGDEPSKLLDPGEWLGVSDLYAAAAADQLENADLADAGELARAYNLLTSSVAALDEVMKFIPADGDTPPEGAFWTQGGRLLFEAMPERFERVWLLREGAERRRRVADFENEYGESDDLTKDDDED
jgi:hypothetical protein